MTGSTRKRVAPVIRPTAAAVEKVDPWADFTTDPYGQSQPAGDGAEVVAELAVEGHAGPAREEAPDEADDGPPARLVVIIPTKGRPTSVARMVEAFEETGAFAQGAAIYWAIDPTDPAAALYEQEITARNRASGLAGLLTMPNSGMAHPTNTAARIIVEDWPAEIRPAAVAFFGDDHVPRTHGWVDAALEALEAMPGGTGIVYPNDGHRGERLATCWIMSTNIVERIHRVVPCLVNHLFADDSVMALGKAAGCLRYLPDVLVEHMHPLAGKAEDDDTYRSTDNAASIEADGRKYRRWLDSPRFAEQVAAVRSLVAGRTVTSTAGLSTTRHGGGVVGPR